MGDVARWTQARGVGRRRGQPSTAMADETKEKEKPTCFIAMPISTPEHLIPEYGNDGEHFIHVLHELFIPAIEDAGFRAIPPIAQGSEIIHGDIIDNLVNASLVLVDMSSLNANVFFEFGIRSALNKPVCLVRDDKTLKIPFDAGTANHHVYNNSLQAWVVKMEKPKLTEHVKASAQRSGGKNSLWQHFGVRAVGEAPKEPGDAKDMMRLLLAEISELRGVVAGRSVEIPTVATATLDPITVDNIKRKIRVARIPKVRAVGFDGTDFLIGMEDASDEVSRQVVRDALTLDLEINHPTRILSLAAFEREVAIGKSFYRS